MYEQESKEHWDDFNQRSKALATVLRKEKEQNQESRARNARDSIMTKYGLSEAQKQGACVIPCPFMCFMP